VVAHLVDVAQRVIICEGDPILLVLLGRSTLRLDCLRTVAGLLAFDRLERCRGLEHLVLCRAQVAHVGSDLGRHAAEDHAYNTLTVRILAGCGEAAREEGHG
jgi:hypothetical protein